MKFFLLLTVLLSAVVVASQTSTLPHLVKFAGSAAAGTSSVTFAIYATEDASAPLWLETQSVTADETGHYTVLLGSTTADGLPASIFSSGDARWIGVKIGDAQESARTLLVSVPYALKAGDAETLGGKPLSAFVLSDTNAAANDTTAGSTKAQRLKSIAETGKANPDPTAPGDSGTQNHLAKFASDGITLGDSSLTENGGRLGIGTTFPNFPLELVGSNVELLQRNPNATSYAGMRFYNDQNTALHALEIDYSGSAYPGPLVAGGPAGESAAITSNGPFPLTLGTNNAVRVTVAGSGNVGIGTNSPTFPLELATAAGGFLQRNTNASSYTTMRLYNDQNSNSRALEIDYAGSNYTGSLVGLGPTGESASLATTGAFPLTLGTSNAARVLISPNGNVGIGTITPSTTLDVNGQVRAANGFKFPDGSVQTTAAASGGSGTVTSISSGAGVVSTPNPITTAGTLALNFTSAGGDNGSGTTVARGDHAHDGRYLQLSPQNFVYSNASLTGRYAFSFFGITPAAGGGIIVATGIGTFQANGNGQITSGSITEITSSGACQGNMSGTYSVSSSGQATASLFFTVVSGPCLSGATPFTLLVSQQGSSFVFAESDNASWTSGAGHKQ